MDKQYSNKGIPLSVPRFPILIFFPIYGSGHLKKLTKCLGNIYPHIEFRFAFQSIKCIENFPF